jgi:predicted transcriptional regulator
MGRTLRTQVALYLDDDRVELLSRLAKKTGQTKQALLRAALDAVLIKHGLLKLKRKP